MNYKEKSKDELIIELQKLKEEYEYSRKFSTAEIKICRQMEINLLDQQEKLSLVLDNASIGIWDWNLITSKISISKKWKKKLGFEEDEIINNLEQLTKKIHPEDEESVEKSIHNYLNKLTSTCHIEYRIINLSGNYCWILSEGITVTWDELGNATRFIATIKDITAEKEATLDPKKSESLYKSILNITPGTIAINNLEKELSYLSLNTVSDSTYIKNVEEGLLEKKIQLQTLYDNLPGVMLYQLILYPDGTKKFSHISNSVHYFTGKTPEEIINDSTFLYNSILKEDKSILDAAEQASFLNNKTLDVEIRCQTHKGEIRWINIISNPSKLNNGNVAWNGIQIDITDKKLAREKVINLNMDLEKKINDRTEQLEKSNARLLKENEERKYVEKALRESEIKYRSVIENVNEVIFQTDTDGSWLFLNKSWEEITGFSINQSLGKLFTNFIHPDDREKCIELFAPVINREKDYCRHQARYLTKDGGFRWLEVFAKVGLDEQNKISGTYGTLQDITERKLAEAALLYKTTELENFFFVSLDMLCIADATGLFIKVNKAFETILGYTVAELEGRNFLQFVHPDDLQPTLDLISKMKEEQQPSFYYINRYKKKDGNYLIFEWCSVPVGNLIYAAARDITERKKAEDFEAELLQLSSQLTGVSSNEINDVIKLALSKIGQFFGVDRSYVFEFDKEESLMSNTFEWCAAGIVPTIETLQDLPFASVPRWMEKLNKHKFVLIPCVKDLPETWKLEYEILATQGIQSIIVFPLLVENNLTGFVGLDSVTKKKVYSNSEINILKVWSSLIASLINKQKIETLLEQTRNNYETYFNTTDDFLWILNENGTIIHVNNTIIKRLGYTSDELVNESILIAYQEERREEAVFNIGELIAGRVENCQIPIKTKYDILIPVETKVKKGFWNGNPAIFGVNKDISKIKLSEQKFSTAFHSNSSMMVISNFKSGEIIEVNTQYAEILGYTKEELVGKNPTELNILLDHDIWKHLTDDINNNNIAVKKQEFQLRKKDGAIITGLLSADAILIGNEQCILAVIVDITQRKKEEEDLNNARQEADRANREKSEFLSRMSHELRTPMNSILGFAQLLEMGELNKSQQKGVTHILNSGKHLLDLINEVLDMSRIEAGHIFLSLKPLQLIEIISEIINTVQPLANAKQLKLQLVPSPNNLLFVKSDRQRLKQVLLNLINNACKYIDKGGEIFIKVETVAIQNTGIQNIKISIIDTGWGIFKEDLPKLFNPFERLGASNTNIEGTGLGLSVVKKLMDAMDGYIGVASIPGKGSTFWIELPESKNVSHLIEKINNLTVAENEIALNSGTILYIEDNASNIELLKSIFLHHRPGYQLITNKYGKETVNLAIVHTPDLILLDLNLPDIHGSEVIKLLQLEEQTKTIPVVVISADAMPKQVDSLLKAGAKNYLVKPLEISTFLRVIDKWIIESPIIKNNKLKDS